MTPRETLLHGGTRLIREQPDTTRTNPMVASRLFSFGTACMHYQDMPKIAHLSRIFRPFATDRKATSAIEFAMLAPLFILLLLGMVAYGIYFGASHSVQQITSDAARTALAGLDATERKDLVSAFIHKNAAEYPFIDKTMLAFEAADSASDANQFVVTVNYDARNLPIWSLLKGLPLPGTTISRQSTIRIGGI